jgi:acyl-CoA-binding protein
MTTENNARAAISIFDDDATEVQGVKMLLDQRKIKGVYNLNGQKLDGDNDRKLPAGIYIIDGQKVMVK